MYESEWAAIGFCEPRRMQNGRCKRVSGIKCDVEYRFESVSALSGL